jgi:hypothetical protein
MLIASAFRDWKEHLEFLIDYMNMLRARSPLFFAQVTRTNRQARFATIIAVNHEGRQLTLDSLEGKPMTETWVRNRTLVAMREEIEKRSQAEWSAGLNWCVRSTDSLNEPVITAQHALVTIGPPNPGSDGAIHYFPICWQACLIGATFKFEVETDAFNPAWLKDLHRIYMANETDFLVSAQPI